LLFSPDSRFLAMASKTGPLRVVQDLSEDFELIPPELQQPIRAIQFSPDSRLLAAAVGNRLDVWSLEDHALVMRSSELKSPVLTMEFLPDSSAIYVVPSIGEITKWSIVDGRLISSVQGRYGVLYVARICSGSHMLAVATMRGGLRLLDLEDGAELRVIQERERESAALAWSRDGRWLALANTKSHVKLWDLSSWGEDAETRQVRLKSSWRRTSLIIAMGFGLCLVLTILMAWWDWPAAVVACLVLETARDPILKLSGNQPLFLAVSIVWVMVALIAVYRSRSALSFLNRQYSELKPALVLIALALIPGAVISLARFPHGWALSATGACSYLLPLLGIALGAACVNVPGMVVRYLAVFVSLSVIGSLTALPESALWNFPGLGGRDYVWYRSFFATAEEMLGILPLICGIYRSPDALGLHAALGLMYVAVLLVVRGKSRSLTWGFAAVVLTAGLLFSGRRKMMAMLIVFGIGWVLTEFRRPERRRIVGLIVIFLMLGLVIVLAMTTFDAYPAYLNSLIQDAWPRLSQSLATSPETVRQLGFWGAGLGTATQGVQRLVRHDLHIWQEDGLSRAFAELGVPGALLVLIAIGFMARAGVRAWRSSPSASLVHGMLLVALANVACFFVSHQIYSGDAPMLLMTSMCLGFALGTKESSESETPRMLS
jgi:hypothetical protein